MRHLLLLLALLFASNAQAQTAPTDASARSEYSVLLVGNSLISTNNLPALLRAVGTANGVAITTRTFAAPGGKLADRLAEGQVAKALAARHFDAIVLQEQGGHLGACMAGISSQRKAPCAASRRAYASLAELAQARGARVLLMATWGPDDRWTARVARSVDLIARDTDAKVFHAGRLLRALQSGQPEVKVLPDGVHPSTQASLLLALALFHEVTGRTPQAHDLRINAPLLPVNAAVSPASPMEEQPDLAGDGRTIVVPASLITPLLEVLSRASAEMVPADRRR